jgi:LysM repeat protein/ABC-type branched-subunit amino acid transport system substrate-binding protein
MIKPIKFSPYLFFGLLLIHSFSVRISAQEPGVKVVRSTEKVLLNGKVYFIHTVKKKETVYSICKAYDITPNLLSKENPSVILGLQPGQVLKIPEEVDQDNYPKEDGKFIYHKVKKGETFYSLSKQYNITVQELREMNPGLNINDIPTDTILRIPRIDFQEEVQEFNVQKEPYFFYKVKKRDNYASIAGKFGLTVKELKEANKDMHKHLKRGDIIKIPEKKELEHKPEIVIETTPVSDSLMVKDTLCETAVPSFFTNKVKVALLLPLYLDENDVREWIDSSEVDQFGRKKYKKITRDDDWIYNKSQRFVEFYNGVIIAMKNLQQKGMDIDLTVFDTEQDPVKVRSILQQGNLENMDVIIGPVYSVNVKMVTDFLENKQTIIVSPFAQKEDLLSSNPSLFQVKPSYSIETEMLAGVISRDYGKNIVIVRPDDTLNIQKINLFKWRLVDSLKQYGPVENVILKEVFFSKNRARRDTINEISDALVEDEENTIIVLSQKETFVSEVLAKIFTLSGDYKLKVYGFPAWQQFRNIQLDYFHQMDLYLCSPYHLDYNKKEVVDFLRVYRNDFKTEPTQFSFAWTGYDVTSYFLTGFGMYGEDFLKCYPGFKAEFLLNGFEFKRYNENGGGMNHHMFFLQYTKDFREEKITLPLRPPSFKPVEEDFFVR